MHAQLVKVLYPDETAMFPVYCVYNDKSFMGSAMEYGYLAVTDKGRLLMIRYDFIGDGNCGSCPLTAIKRLKIKKLLIGQYKLEFTLIGFQDDSTGSTENGFRCIPPSIHKFKYAA